jgi:hypothetical protein
MSIEKDLRDIGLDDVQVPIIVKRLKKARRDGYDSACRMPKEDVIKFKSALKCDKAIADINSICSSYLRG